MSAAPGEALTTALAQASRSEVPDLRLCLRISQLHEQSGDLAQAVHWAFAAIDAGDDLAGWLAAAKIVDRCRAAAPPLPRSARVAVLGSSTTSQLVALLPLAAARCGVEIEVYECHYGQYRQEVLDPSSGLYAFGPDVVVLAVHDGAVDLPGTSSSPDEDVARELRRWTSLWETITARTGARVVQYTFAIPPETALGHLAARVPGSRYSMLQRLNHELGGAAGQDVSLVDCERLASFVGKKQWFDARYWHLAKQAVSLNDVPLLARHTAAVLAAGLGQSRKCLVLDLDNTLWGGVLGEDGLSGLKLGEGPVGEAFTAFQSFVLELQAKGVVLAVCSKNNENDAREAFEKHPGMLIKLDDIAVFLANWEDKPSQIRRIADILGLGLDALVFVDDNPAEREAVRQLVPEVDVVPLPAHPAGYVRALAQYPLFETAAMTQEDASRTRQYQARTQTALLQEEATSLADFQRSLLMQADVRTLTADDVPRVTQLIGKTNQFNLTGRRRTPAEVAGLVEDTASTVLTFRLRDRFVDHGLVGVLICRQEAGALEIDTWLMSCRVIGRTLEDEMLAAAVREAHARGLDEVHGTYVRTAKNQLVSDLYDRLGFETFGQEEDARRYRLRVADHRWTDALITLV